GRLGGRPGGTALRRSGAERGRGEGAYGRRADRVATERRGGVAGRSGAGGVREALLPFVSVWRHPPHPPSGHLLPEGEKNWSGVRLLFLSHSGRGWIGRRPGRVRILPRKSLLYG